MDDEKIIPLYFERDEDAQECVNDTYLNAWNAIPLN